MAFPHTYPKIMQAALIELGYGSAPTSNPNNAVWPIYLYKEIQNPDNLIVVKNNESQSNGSNQHGGTFSYPQVEVRVRGLDLSTAFEKIRTLKENIDSAWFNTAFTINSTDYVVQHFNRTTDIISMGQDVSSSRRHVFTMTVNLIITPQA